MLNQHKTKIMFKFFTKERYASTYGFISKHKNWELEAGKHEDWSWFFFVLKWTRNCDHAGLDFNFELLGFWISFTIYDCRHWNYEEKRYYLPGEELQESLK